LSEGRNKKNLGIIRGVVMKKLVVILFLTLAMGLKAEKPIISSGRYLGGGIAGTIIGFGVGHAIQGRYQSEGWIFTVSELGALGVATVGSVLISRAAASQQVSPLGLTIGVVGYLVFGGLKIWEIVDVWTGAVPYNPPSSGHAAIDAVTEGQLAALASTRTIASSSMIDFINFKF